MHEIGLPISGQPELKARRSLVEGLRGG